MTKVGPRTYEVSEGDFPIQASVQAVELPFCQAVVSDVQIKKDGAPAGAEPVIVVDYPANLSIHYEIRLPGKAKPADLVQVIDGTFPNNPPDASRYRVTLTSAAGDVEETAGTPPTINPRTIVLKFLYR